MEAVVEPMDLSVAGRANLNCGAGVKPLAFRLLARNQVVFGESEHLLMAKFAGLRLFRPFVPLLPCTFSRPVRIRSSNTEAGSSLGACSTSSPQKALARVD